MNRQALAFLTLFSLILMLSVYYVTLPPDATSVMSEQDQQPKEEISENENARTSLQEEADKKKDEEINKNSNIVSSPDNSDADKQKALETIDQLKDAKALQDEIVKALSDAGYMAAVEINDQTCIVSIFEQEESKELAKSIMKLVNSKVKDQYLVEVTFK